MVGRGVDAVPSGDTIVFLGAVDPDQVFHRELGQGTRAPTDQVRVVGQLLDTGDRLAVFVQVINLGVGVEHMPALVVARFGHHVAFEGPNPGAQAGLFRQHHEIGRRVVAETVAVDVEEARRIVGFDVVMYRLLVKPVLDHEAPDGDRLVLLRHPGLEDFGQDAIGVEPVLAVVDDDPRVEDDLVAVVAYRDRRWRRGFGRCDLIPFRRLAHQVAMGRWLLGTARCQQDRG